LLLSSKLGVAYAYTLAKPSKMDHPQEDFPMQELNRDDEEEREEEGEGDTLMPGPGGLSDDSSEEEDDDEEEEKRIRDGFIVDEEEEEESDEEEQESRRKRKKRKKHHRRRVYTFVSLHEFSPIFLQAKQKIWRMMILSYLLRIQAQLSRNVVSPG
jgi:cobalamin biosynthesis protein CobT